MIRHLLVANRGEIAVRVFRAARELGIETIGVYPDGDARGLHLLHCDRAVHLDGADPQAAYLDIDGVLRAAKQAGADAVHPGYGFLSENPAFARRVEAEGLLFVGPSPETMERFGVKTRAREMMREAGVPTVPGTTGAVADPDAAAGAAAEVGYPVLLKASHGGGGRGIRPVAAPEELPRAFETASREAAQAFGSGELYVEKLLQRPRHIEVQVMGDGRGGAVHFFERDCSMQRRNQKLIEESPAPNLDGQLRARLLTDAVRAAKAGNYRSAGTVEFLVAGGEHYFLEVNARLQVEHPVTEMVTVIDLVKLQLELADGKAALPRQEDIYLHGHALECRINAEDSRRNFMPAPGRIGLWQPPSGPGVRVDGAGFPGGEVSPHFDSLLAKVIVHGRTRPEAIARMRQALQEFVVTGVRTTIPFHRFALDSPAFDGGNYTTATVGELGRPPPPNEAETKAAALAALIAHAQERPAAPRAAPQNRRRRAAATALRTPFGPAGSGWFHEL